MRKPGAAIAALRDEVCTANVELFERGLARFTFGNASAIDRPAGLVVIKPSGLPYTKLQPKDLVVVALDGSIVEGELRPSSDLPTHLELYRAFTGIGGVVHTHSHYATVWAQSQREIPCLGTTHADYFHGPIPITEHLTTTDIEQEYEANTGREIVRRFAGMDPMRMPAVLVKAHASFCWGASVGAAVETADLLEEVARMAYATLTLNHAAEPLPAAMLDKHFLRKHGPNAYYGQVNR
ncbi:MAG TPA: L-ribulose-5-phosphate 4-epimerase AraD [Gemmatimonadaceae bacterium]|nr:L-ribulose-5-phosphate 4-epimerase AraD [Gemmatimonadaceae bacterium]